MKKWNIIQYASDELRYCGGFASARLGIYNDYWIENYDFYINLTVYSDHMILICQTSDAVFTMSNC